MKNYVRCIIITPVVIKYSAFFVQFVEKTCSWIWSHDTKINGFQPRFFDKLPVFLKDRFVVLIKAKYKRPHNPYPIALNLVYRGKVFFCYIWLFSHIFKHIVGKRFKTY